MKFTTLSGIAVSAALAGAIGFTALAFAADADVIAARRALMKANGGAAKVIGAMLDGSAKFDAAAADDGAKAMVAAGHGFGADFDKNFPDSTMTGDTKASPDVWKNKDDFKKLAMAFEADATAAVAAAAKGEGDFKAAAGKVFGNCKGCHEKYKMK